MKTNLIVIDGKTYHSVDEMPPDIRQKYEQAMGALGDIDSRHSPDEFEDMDGLVITDFLRSNAGSKSTDQSIKIIIDGKEFSGVENLPPEVRAKYEEAMGKLDANRNGIPDFVEGMLNVPSQTASVSTRFETEAPPRSAPLPVDPAITPDTSNGWMLASAALFILILCSLAFASVWYFFLR